MTTYRVYPTDGRVSLWEDFIVTFEAANDEEARAKALLEANLEEADLVHFTIAPLPTEMEYECVCSETPVLFKREPVNDEHPDVFLWQCQNCQKVFIAPPDEINWENERMFAEGYVPCGCDHYDIRCRCQGAGWWHPEEDEDGPIARFEYEDDDHGGNPYYEEDGYYEMDDEEDDDSGDDDPYLDDPYYDPNLELEMGD